MDLKNTVQTIADFIPQYCRRNKVILQDKTRKTERKKQMSITGGRTNVVGRKLWNSRSLIFATGNRR